MAKCELHGVDQEWITISPGKTVLRCRDCHNRVRVQEVKNNDMPRVKYAQNFFRDRPWNEKERTSPFGRARKPVD